MWKITKKHSQEYVFVYGSKGDYSKTALFEKSCFTNDSNVATHFMNNSNYEVKEVRSEG